MATSVSFGHDGRPFVLLQSMDDAERKVVRYLQGDIAEHKQLTDIPRKAAKTDKDVYDTFSILPFSQIQERSAEGSALFKAHNAGEMIITLTVSESTTLPEDEVLKAIPAVDVALEGDLTFNMTDKEYEKVIEHIVVDEIGNGEGSSFVTPRKASGVIKDFNGVPTALGIFRRLLLNEYGCYWKFIFYTGKHFFISASPERHLEVRKQVVRMNPISGTFRKDHSESPADNLKRLKAFLQDEKEINELFMVTDEELKMMATMCRKGGTIIGPLLKEMAHLIHTEYLLEGHSDDDIIDLLRKSMYAPTVTGSPMGNACKVVNKYEAETRSYYSSAAVLVGRGSDGEFLDSCITIRTLEVSPTGTFTIRVGATLVKDSVPSEEVKECDAKIKGAVAALKMDRQFTTLKWRDDPEVVELLGKRNAITSKFWMQHLEQLTVPEIAGKRIVLSNNEDDFIFMLRHVMERMGAKVEVYDFFKFGEGGDMDKAIEAADICVVGPGPGDPNDEVHRSDGKMVKVRGYVKHLLATKKPFLAVCLGHQVLCKHFGFDVVRKDLPTQGIQLQVDLYGRRQAVGFYNAFYVKHNPSKVAELGLTEVSVDPAIDDLLATRGEHWESCQFHPESILSADGFDIVKAALVRLATLGTKA